MTTIGIINKQAEIALLEGAVTENQDIWARARAASELFLFAVGAAGRASLELIRLSLPLVKAGIMALYHLALVGYCLLTTIVDALIYFVPRLARVAAWTTTDYIIPGIVMTAKAVKNLALTTAVAAAKAFRWMAGAAVEISYRVVGTAAVIGLVLIKVASILAQVAMTAARAAATAAAAVAAECRSGWALRNEIIMEQRAE